MSLAAEELATKFGVADYVVFAMTLAASAAIGVYFGCTGGQQRTNQEFLMGDRSMSLVPVSMSLFASFMSAIAILGTPAEIYTYGTMYLWIVVSYGTSMYIAGYVYIPVFYRLQVTSAYEYMEMRFNKAVRVLGAVCYILQMVMYMSIVLYAPSLALSAVTGIQTWVSVLSVGGVCAFYTALGGLKAVIWTDTLQALIMFSGMLAVVIQGVINLGWDRIWMDAAETGRLDLFSEKAFDPNPMERHTFWSLVVGGTVYWAGTYGTNQAQIQRLLALPSLKKAQLSLWINLPCLMLIILISGFAGLIILSQYRYCDPIQFDIIKAKDQLYPLFVMETLGHIPGLPGLIVAAVTSGSLSTVSSGLNSLAAVTQLDIINQLFSRPVPEHRAAIFTKVIAAVYGLLCIALTFVVGSLGGVLQAGITFFGAFGGPIAGVFSLGMFFPWANSHGAIAGLLSSTVMTLWISLGAQFNKGYVYQYETSIEQCPLIYNATTTTSATLELSTNASVANTTGLANTTLSVEELVAKSREGLGGLYSLSYLWMTPIACLVCAVVGLAVSFATGGTKSPVEARLISPVFDKFCCCLPRRWREKLYCGVDHSEPDEQNVDGKEQEENSKV